MKQFASNKSYKFINMKTNVEMKLRVQDYWHEIKIYSLIRDVNITTMNPESTSWV